MLNKRIQLILFYFITSLCLVTFYYFDPANYHNIYPPSLVREWGGFYCAGCGMLRAIHQLLHGNWQAALRYNPLSIIFLPYFFYWFAPYFLKYFYQIEPYTIRNKEKQILAIIIICSVYGILRNIPSPALFWLVPPT